MSARDVSIVNNYIADLLMTVDLPDHSKSVRENPSDMLTDWGHVLSGGERQKLSMAR